MQTHRADLQTVESTMPTRLDRLIDYIDYHSTRVGDRPALVSGSKQVLWSELPSTVDRLASALAANGIGRGDRVGVWMPPTVDALLLFLACGRIGALFVGINPKYRADEVRHVLTDAEPALVFAAIDAAEPNYRGELAAITAETTTIRFVCFSPDTTGSESLDTFVAEGRGADDPVLPALRDAVAPADPITIVYTSGSTGKPKGALLTHQGFAHNFWEAFKERHMEWLKVPAFFTINHQAGLGDVAALAFVAGGTQYFMQRFDPQRLVELIETERLTYLPALVTHLQLLFRDVDVAAHDLSSLEYIWWGGALIPEGLLKTLGELAPRTSTDFGQTETHGPLIYTPVDASLEDKSLTIGRITDPARVRIADADGNPVPPGTPGEIQAFGAQTAPGYWRNETASKALYTADGWLRTGDRAVAREDGYVTMVGRISEMFKSGGYNVYPAEIELAIGAVPGVDMAVVVSIPDEMYQEVGVAFVTCKAGHDLYSQQLQDHLRSRLANYKIPKHIHICAELPRTIVGKIDKPLLKRLASGEQTGLDALVGTGA